MNEALDNEVLSINAIYDPDTLTMIDKSNATFVLRVPSSNISLRISFPPDYPDNSPPIVQGPESSGSECRKGEANEAVMLAREVLGICFRPGEPCIYDLLEDIVVQLQSRIDLENSASHRVPAELAASPLDTTPVWVISEPITEKKSVFVARAVHVGTVNAAQTFIEHLIATDKKVAKATHNISAWRVRGALDEVVFQDSDDDGETAAGGRLLHLLQSMDVWNVLVVVSRWYGGIHLGPDRFRIINTVARDALIKGNFGVETKKGNHTKPKKQS